MRSAIFAVAFTLCSASGWATEMPPKTDNPEGWTAWEAYSRVLLIRLYPSWADYIAHQPIVILGSRDPNMTSIHSAILINYGLIEFVTNESEYAAALAHEFSHVFRGHVGVPVKNVGAPTGREIKRVERQEVEADKDALRAMKGAGLNHCFSATLIGRLLDATGQRSRPENPISAMNLRREAILIRACASR